MAKILKCDGCLIAEVEMGVARERLTEGWRILEHFEVDENGDADDRLERACLCPECYASVASTLNLLHVGYKAPTQLPVEPAPAPSIFRGEEPPVAAADDDMPPF